MHRGINILDDDPMWRDPARARFQPRHFARLAQAGFDTVRLNLHPFKHLNAAGTPDPAWLATLDGLVKTGLGAGLTVCALAAGVVLNEVWRTSTGDFAAVATNLAYPAGDALLLGLVAIGVSVLPADVAQLLTRALGDVTGHRIADVIALAPKLDAAIAKAYENIRKIRVVGSYFRTDIGQCLWPPGNL